MNRLETIYTHATCDKCGSTNRWPDCYDVDRNHIHCGSCKVKLLRRNVEKLSIWKSATALSPIDAVRSDGGAFQMPSRKSAGRMIRDIQGQAHLFGEYAPRR